MTPDDVKIGKPGSFGYEELYIRGEDGIDFVATDFAARLLLDYADVTNQEAFQKIVGTVQEHQGDLAAAEFVRIARQKAIAIRMGKS